MVHRESRYRPRRPPALKKTPLLKAEQVPTHTHHYYPTQETVEDYQRFLGGPGHPNLEMDGYGSTSGVMPPPNSPCSLPPPPETFYPSYADAQCGGAFHYPFWQMIPLYLYPPVMHPTPPVSPPVLSPPPNFLPFTPPPSTPPALTPPILTHHSEKAGYLPLNGRDTSPPPLQLSASPPSSTSTVTSHGGPLPSTSASPSVFSSTSQAPNGPYVSIGTFYKHRIFVGSLARTVSFSYVSFNIGRLAQTRSLRHPFPKLFFSVSLAFCRNHVHLQQCLMFIHPILIFYPGNSIMSYVSREKIEARKDTIFTPDRSSVFIGPLTPLSYL